MYAIITKMASQVAQEEQVNKRQIERLSEEVKTLRRANEMLRQEAEELRQENSSLRAMPFEQSDAAREIVQLREENGALAQQLLTTKQEAETRRVRCCELLNSEIVLRKELKFLSCRFKESQKASRRNHAHLVRANNELTAKVASLTASNDKLTAQSSSTTGECGKMSELVKTLVDANMQLVDVNETAVAALQQLEQQLADEKSDVDHKVLAARAGTFAAEARTAHLSTVAAIHEDDLRDIDANIQRAALLVDKVLFEQIADSREFNTAKKMQMLLDFIASIMVRPLVRFPKLFTEQSNTVYQVIEDLCGSVEQFKRLSNEVNGGVCVIDSRIRRLAKYQSGV